MSLPKLKKFWKVKTHHIAFAAYTSLRCFDSCHWYLDSDCSRHMSGDKSVFKLFNEDMDGIVTFGDRKRSQIKANDY